MSSIGELSELFKKKYQVEEIIIDHGERKIFKGLDKESNKKVIIKVHENLDKAIQEYRNTCIVQEMLKDSKIKSVVPLERKGNILVFEYIEGKQISHESEKDLKLSIDYMILLHNTHTDNKLDNHYYGDHLINRLNNEKYYFNECLKKFPSTQIYQEKFDLLLKNAIDVASYHVPWVVGHGDFQPNNIMIDNHKAIIPIDWNDFGKVNKWYEIGNLLFLQKKEKFLDLILYYLNRGIFPIADHDQIMNQASKSVVMTFIIRIGSIFRTLDNENFENKKKDIIDHFDYIENNFPNLLDKKTEIIP